MSVCIVAVAWCSMHPLPVFLGLGGILGSLCPPPPLTCVVLSPSSQDVCRRWLWHSREQRCPAKPPVLLAARHGGNTQPDRGECPRPLPSSWRTDAEKCLLMPGSKTNQLENPCCSWDPVELLCTPQGWLIAKWGATIVPSARSGLSQTTELIPKALLTGCLRTMAAAWRIAEELSAGCKGKGADLKTATWCVAAMCCSSFQRLEGLRIHLGLYSMGCLSTIHTLWCKWGISIVCTEGQATSAHPGRCYCPKCHLVLSPSEIQTLG